MRKLRNQDGFTLIELMIVLVIVVVVFGVGVVLTGNFWYSEDNVLKDIRIDNPEAVHVIRSHRNVVRYSVFEVKNEDGSRTTYELDTNILFNYETQRAPG